MKKRKFLLILFTMGILLLAACTSSIERKLLLFPGHRALGPNDTLKPWAPNGVTIGYARTVPAPRNIWLMTHGNAGQALDREYALPCFSPEDSVFILEYPGFGQRPGTPTFKAFQSAAAEAYKTLRDANPKTPICVVGESIGSGPASFLATQNPPPDKIVLVVPFDTLDAIARDHVPGWMVHLLLSHKWNNIESLANYKGPIDIFAASHDNVIKPDHARALAHSIPHAKFTLIDGGHNDWSRDDRVRIRNP